jgi:flagellar assembly factor FliW
MWMLSTLESRRFGTMQVTEEAVVQFPEGLPGFEDLREFLLLNPPGLEPVKFLVSRGDPEISFPILAADLCFEGYAQTLDRSALQAMGAPDPSTLAIYAILTFHHEGELVTANLRAPVLINPTTQIGRQVTMLDCTHSLRHALVGS